MNLPKAYTYDTEDLVEAERNIGNTAYIITHDCGIDIGVSKSKG